MHKPVEVSSLALVTLLHYTYVRAHTFYAFIHSEVVKLLSLNFSRNETSADNVERSRQYLVILEVNGGVPFFSWPKDKIRHVDTSVETTIAIADLQVPVLLYCDNVIPQS